MAPPTELDTRTRDYRLFTADQVLLATMFGSYFGGGLLAFHNARRLGRPRQARAFLTWTLTWTLVLHVAAGLVGERLMVFPVWAVIMVTMHRLALWKFWDDIAAHLQAGGRTGSYLVAMLLGVAGGATAILLCFLFWTGVDALEAAAQEPVLQPREIVASGHDRVLLLDGVTREDGEELASALRSYGVFGNEYEFMVAYRLTNGVPTVSFPLLAGAWDDRDNLLYWRNVGFSLLEDLAVDRVRMELCDGRLRPRKVLWSGRVDGEGFTVWYRDTISTDQARAVWGGLLAQGHFAEDRSAAECGIEAYGPVVRLHFDNEPGGEHVESGYRRIARELLSLCDWPRIRLELCDVDWNTRITLEEERRP